MAEPIVGYAGDVTFIGYERQFASTALARIIASHAAMRTHSEPVYVMWQLALWRCFLRELQPTDPRNSVLREHQHAAAPFIRNEINKELAIEPSVCVPASN